MNSAIVSTEVDSVFLPFNFEFLDAS